MIIFYDPKFIKLKPAIKNTTSHNRPLIKKKLNPPIRINFPHLFLDKEFFNFLITNINFQAYLHKKSNTVSLSDPGIFAVHLLTSSI